MSAEFKVTSIPSSDLATSFAYGFYVTRKPGVTRHTGFLLVSWCEDNFGPHGVQWSWTFMPMTNCWRLVFRSQVDASAFKIRWA